MKLGSIMADGYFSLNECYSQDHRSTKSQSLMSMRSNLAHVVSLGYVVGSENCFDAAVPFFTYNEANMEALHSMVKEVGDPNFGYP